MLPFLDLYILFYSIKLVIILNHNSNVFSMELLTKLLNVVYLLYKETIQIQIIQFWFSMHLDLIWVYI